MDKDRYDFINQRFGQFSAIRLQEIVTAYRLADGHGITVIELMIYAESRKKEIVPDAGLKARNIMICPECQSRMRLQWVDEESHWICPQCRRGVFNG